MHVPAHAHTYTDSKQVPFSMCLISLIDLQPKPLIQTENKNKLKEMSQRSLFPHLSVLFGQTVLSEKAVYLKWSTLGTKINAATGTTQSYCC